MEVTEQVATSPSIPGPAQDATRAARRLWFCLFPFLGLATAAVLFATRSPWSIALGPALFLGSVAAVVRRARPEWSARRLLGLTVVLLGFFIVPYLALGTTMGVPHVAWLLAGPVLWILPMALPGFVLTLPLALSGIAGWFGIRGNPLAGVACCPLLVFAMGRSPGAWVFGATALSVVFGLVFLPPREPGSTESKTVSILTAWLEVVGILSAIGFSVVLCVFMWSSPSWHLVVALLIPLIWLPTILSVMGWRRRP